MGNCCHPFGIRNESSKKRQKKIVLLLVGLDNAGKTTAAKRLIGEPINTVVPTVGFSSVSLKHQGCNVIIYDLGGGPQIRGIWHRYFVDVHGIIFVVDASDETRLDEGREVLENLLTHEKLTGKPMLLLANKQDHEKALDELDIVEKLNLETLVNHQRCPTLVEMCSATAAKNARKKLDPAIHNGFKWLMNCIIRDFSKLNKRVEEDVAVQKKINEQEKKERLERILKAREERGEDDIGNGTCNGGVNEDSDNDVVMPDPFKPISEHMKKVDFPAKESDHDNRVILVKESPRKIMPKPEIKHSADNNMSNNIKTSQDIEVEQSFLMKNSGGKESMNPGSGDRNWFGSAVSVKNVPSPTHSITELIKDQLELEAVKPKKRPFLRRTNRTAPAPLGPSLQLLSIETDNEKEMVLQQQKTVDPSFCRKQAFTEEINILKDGQDFPIIHNDFSKKQSSDRSSLFCIPNNSTSSEQLENIDSALEIHMTNSADSKKRRMPFMGKLSLINSKVLPGSTETSLSNMDTFQSSVESDRITVIKQMSSDSTSLADGSQNLKEHTDHPVTSPIKQWDIDKFGLQNENVDISSGVSIRNVTNRQSSNESHSRSNSRQNSAQRNDVKLQKQSSLDETSTTSCRSKADSQQLSDSGFVSPKNILPPLRPNSSVDRPPWILPPLTSRIKHSSQDSILECTESNNAADTSRSNREDKSENSEEVQKSESLQ